MAPESTARKDDEAPPAKKARKRTPKLFRRLSHPNARAQRAFLVAYAKTGNVTRSARAARVTTRSHHHWLDYPGEGGELYRQAFAEACEMAADFLEEEAHRRAVKGLVRYRFTKDGTPLKHPKTGKPYFELEYSDNLLRDLLRGNRPEKFRDKRDGLSVEAVVALVTQLTASIRAEVTAAIADRQLAQQLLASIQAHVSRALELPDVTTTALAVETAPEDAP